MTDGQLYDLILAGVAPNPFQHIERTSTGYFIINGASKWDIETDALGNIIRERLDYADLAETTRLICRSYASP